MKKALVALSGGIDSAAAALILYERGYRVTAVTFDLNGNPDDVESVRRLAERIRIPLLVEDLRDAFQREVQNHFIDGYMRGETPAPCSVCNPRIKWDALRRVADREGIPILATGHYVRFIEKEGFHYVSKGVDPAKDQSYYLWDLDREILRRATAPLGEFTKTQVRELMTLWGFADLAAKKESMGVCFLGGEGYAGFLRRKVPGIERLDGGSVVDTEGRIVGTHAGYPFYTVGQKRGFALDDPSSEYCVLQIDPATNRLISGPVERLHTDTLWLRDVRIIRPDEFFNAPNLRIKIRGLGVNPAGFCTAVPESGGLRVTVPSGVFAPAKGQPVVFYIDDRVVGGGYLK